MEKPPQKTYKQKTGQLRTAETRRQRTKTRKVGLVRSGMNCVYAWSQIGKNALEVEGRFSFHAAKEV